MAEVGRPLEAFRFRLCELERRGLQSTGREPLHVYCKTCGIEIDPLQTAGQPRGWWLCPRGCNVAIH